MESGSCALELDEESDDHSDEESDQELDEQCSEESDNPEEDEFWAYALPLADSSDDLDLLLLRLASRC